MRHRLVTGLALMALLVAVGSGFATLWPAIGASCLVWTLALGRRLPMPAAFVSGLLVASFGVVVAAMVAPHVPGDLRAAEVAAMAVLVTSGCAIAIRGSNHLRLRADLVVPSLAVASGALVWMTALALADAFGTGRMAWAMAGDAAPHTTLSMAIARAGGLLPSRISEDPVPLVHVLIAAVGRPDMGSSVAHAAQATAQVWAVLVGLAAIMAGLVAKRVASVVGASSRWSTAVAACASLLSTSGIVSGYAFKYGFTNSHLVLVLVSMAVVAALEVGRRPWWSLAALAAVTLALVATWTPLALIPMAIGATALARAWATRTRPGTAQAVVLALVAVGGLTYGLVFQRVALAQAGSALAVDGGLAKLPIITLPLAIVVIGVLTLGMRVRDEWATWALLSALAAMGVGLAGTVALAGNPALGPWSYYPLKYTWQVTVALLPVGIGALGVLARGSSARARWSLAAVSVAVAGLLGGLTLVPHSTVRMVVANPSFTVAAGTIYGVDDEVYDQVVAGTSGEVVPVLWKTDNETSQWVNHWILQSARFDRDDDARAVLHLRSHFIPDANAVCDVFWVLGDDLLVLTSDPGAPAELSLICPGIRVVVGTWDAASIGLAVASDA